MNGKLYNALFHVVCVALGAACLAVGASMLVGIVFAVRYLPEWFSFLNVMAVGFLVSACWVIGYQFLKGDR